MTKNKKTVVSWRDLPSSVHRSDKVMEGCIKVTEINLSGWFVFSLTCYSN